MIRMILGWAMSGLGGNHSVHFIREITVPDDQETRTLASLRDIRMIFRWTMIYDWLGL